VSSSGKVKEILNSKPNSNENSTPDIMIRRGSSIALTNNDHISLPLVGKSLSIYICIYVCIYIYADNDHIGLPLVGEYVNMFLHIHIYMFIYILTMIILVYL
jgi:hypothetical protein